MIATLTMNPAVDRSISVKGFTPGGLNRVRSVRTDAGGKGINVSRALSKLGFPSIALGLLGGPAGRFIEEEVHREGITPHFTWLGSGVSRTNIKIVDEESGIVTELNEAGPTVSRSDLNRLKEDMRSVLRECSYLVCSGSLPPEVPNSWYAEVLESANREGVRCVLDTSGTALSRGIEKLPFLIKPNREELRQLLGEPLSGVEEVRGAAATLLEKGISCVIISLGADGAVFASEEGMFWARAEADIVRGTTGCGDTMVAAAIAAMECGMTWMETARFASAAATAAASLEGTSFPSPDEVDLIKKRVQMEILEAGSAA